LLEVTQTHFLTPELKHVIAPKCWPGVKFFDLLEVATVDLGAGKYSLSEALTHLRNHTTPDLLPLRGADIKGMPKELSVAFFLNQDFEIRQGIKSPGDGGGAKESHE
jgi:hypothetical protein